jgi:hypothetical protein
MECPLEVVGRERRQHQGAVLAHVTARRRLASRAAPPVASRPDGRQLELVEWAPGGPDQPPADRDAAGGRLRRLLRPTMDDGAGRVRVLDQCGRLDGEGQRCLLLLLMAPDLGRLLLAGLQRVAGARMPAGRRRRPAL